MKVDIHKNCTGMDLDTKEEKGPNQPVEQPVKLLHVDGATLIGVGVTKCGAVNAV